MLRHKFPLPEKNWSLGKSHWVFCWEDLSHWPLPSLPSHTDFSLPMVIFSLHRHTTGAIHRDLVKVLVIFMFLEDRNKTLFLLQKKWTYLLCTPKLNSSAWNCIWVITYQVVSFLTSPKSWFPSPGWLWFHCFYWLVSPNFSFCFLQALNDLWKNNIYVCVYVLFLILPLQMLYLQYHMYYKTNLDKWFKLKRKKLLNLV